MADEKRDVLEVLKFELSFLEQGGYGRSVRTPWKATSVFQDSPSCLNFNDPARPHACSECLLTDFVPSEAQQEQKPPGDFTCPETNHGYCSLLVRARSHISQRMILR